MENLTLLKCKSLKLRSCCLTGQKPITKVYFNIECLYSSNLYICYCDKKTVEHWVRASRGERNWSIHVCICANVCMCVWVGVFLEYSQLRKSLTLIFGSQVFVYMCAFYVNRVWAIEQIVLTSKEFVFLLNCWLQWCGCQLYDWLQWK